MKFLSGLVADLRDSRLWPVALLLVGALVAIPLLLAKDAPDPATPDPAAQAAVARLAQESANAQPAVTLTTPRKRDYRKRLKDRPEDPFKQKFLPKRAPSLDAAAAEAGATGAGGASDPGAGGAGGAGGQSDGSSPSPAPDAGTPDTPTARKRYFTYNLDIRFGETGERQVSRDLEPYTALPSADDPVLIYLGVLDDDKDTAVLLVSSAVTVMGDGACKPTPEQCETLHVQKGDTVFFDLPDESGTGVRQFQLDLLRIVREEQTREEFAELATASASASRSAGRAVRRARTSHSRRVRLTTVGTVRYRPRKRRPAAEAVARTSGPSILQGILGRPVLQP